MYESVEGIRLVSEEYSMAVWQEYDENVGDIQSSF